MHYGGIVHILVQLSDEACFNLSGNVNSRNWPAENSMLLSGMSLHYATGGVWCAICVTQTIWPFFWDRQLISMIQFFNTCPITRQPVISLQQEIFYVDCSVLGQKNEGVVASAFTRSELQ